MSETRMPVADDFTMKYDDDHTFDFFEDEQADYLWALGTIDADEFARQANEYDALDGSTEAPYTAAHVAYKPAVIVNDHPGNPDTWRISLVSDTTVAGTVAVISR